MLDPDDLLHLADTLRRVEVESDAGLRRAVSTAYYALFHAATAAAAERFVGSDGSATGAYALIRRGFEHTAMRVACDELDRPSLRPRVAKALGQSGISAEARTFAAAFVTLQGLRNLADYDPQAAFERSDVTTAIVEAARGIAAFRRMDSRERLNVLAFLMVRHRH